MCASSSATHAHTAVTAVHITCACLFFIFVLPRYLTAGFALWSTAPTTRLEPEWQSLAWKVPSDILDLIPQPCRVLLRCADGPLTVVRNFDFVDICSGKARITKWAVTAGLTGAALDVDYGQHMDINSTEGFALAILCVLRVGVGGLVFMACQCSSWIWLSRSSTQRSAENPHGNVRRPSVVEGNSLNVRCALLCLLAHRCCSRWVVEQPDSSLFFDTDSMQTAWKNCGARLIKFRMSIYGHVTRKGTYLLGTADWLEEIGNACAPSAASSSGKPEPPCPPCPSKSPGKPKKPKNTIKAKVKAVALARVHKDGSGRKRVTGNKVALKDSQVYPARFALRVCQLHWPARFGC